jgi:putative tricarboxylic transport membrane protein
MDARRRAFLATLLATPLLMERRRAVGAAVARDAAAPPVLQLLVPAAPGGGWDGLAQAMAKVLRETGAAAEVGIEHLPGAGGALALPRLVVGMRGRPNTLMVGGLTLLSSPIVNESALTVLDTIPIARLEAEPLVLAVAADSPLQTIADFARVLQADPLGLRVAGGSEGSADHILLAMIGQALGIDVYALTYLPFGGGGPAAQAVLDGRARAGISNWSEFAPHIESGRMRALALSGEARHPGVEVPTLREGGIDAVLYNWNGVFAPPGLGEEARTELEVLVDAMVRSAAWQGEAARRRWQVLYLPRREFEPFLKAEIRSVRQTLARLGLVQPRQLP